MKERPIIFSTDMVKAILDGRKTMARRTQGLKLTNLYPDSYIVYANDFGGFIEKNLHHFGKREIMCPYGQVGDRLWVRETFQLIEHWSKKEEKAVPYPIYKAGCPTEGLVALKRYQAKWEPSLFMPRWASRFTLEITEVRAERLQEITTKDKELVAEGIPLIYPPNNRTDWTEMAYQFSLLWDSLNAKRGYGWDKNPWVWVIKFDNIGVRAK